MERIRRKIELCLAFSLLSIGLFASGGKENYEKGWKAFNNNQREEAAHYFQLSTQDSEFKAKAYLSLALLSWNNENKEDGLDYFIKSYPHLKNPYHYLYAMFTNMYVRPVRAISDKQLKFYQQLLSDPNLHGTLRAMVNQELGDYYMACNQAKKAQEYYRQICFLDKWQIVGAFDNISGSGFEKDMSVVAKPEENAVFKDKVNADVHWFHPGANRHDGWFDFNYCFSLDNIIAYAQSFLQSNENQEVILRIGVSGSLKLWLNDALVASVEKERNCDMDVYAYKINLNKGNNRLLVQIGQSEISDANFLIRLTDESGNPISGISSSADYVNYQKNDAPSLLPMLPFFPEQFFENQIKENPEDILNYIALANTYLRNDKSYEGTRILKQAEVLAPHSSFIKLKLSEAYIRSGNRTDHSRMVEFINHNDPKSYFALSNKFEEYNDAEKYTEANEILEEIKDLYGENEETDYMDVEMKGNLNQTDELITLLQRLYVKYPYSNNYMNYNTYIQENVYGNAKASFAVLSKYCKKYADMSAWDNMSDYYFSHGKTAQGLAILQKKIDYNPYAVGFKFNLINRLQQMQRYQEALVLLDDLKKQLPYVSGIYNKEGYIYKIMQKKSSAQKSFEKAIYYNPTDYDSRLQLRLLDNKKEVFDLFPKSNLETLIAQAPTEKDYPEENAVILMYDNQLVFYPEGAQEHRIEIAVKMLNSTAIEEWKEYQIESYGNQRLQLDKYEIIKANGQKIKAEASRGRVVFTNLEAGDVLHLIYRLQDYRSGVLAKHFYDVNPLQFLAPSVYVRYALLAPKDINFEHIVKNADTIAPKITDIENMKLYEWIATRQPAIKSEPFMPPYADVAPTLIFSSIPDWKFVSNWYKDVTANKLNTQQDYIFTETHEQILKDKENVSQLEKVKLFYEYILNNITYSQVSFLQSNLIPQKPSRTLTTRLGDCKDVSTLFVAFCRASGINANLVLVQSRDIANNKMALPTNSFNHCIAQVNIDNKTYYFELTNSKLPFGAVPEENLTANILQIPYKSEAASHISSESGVNGDKLLGLEMPQRKLNEVIRRQEISIENNNMKILHHNARTGQLASWLRYQYGNIGNEERVKLLSQSIASDWNTPIKISDLQFLNLDNLEDSVKYTYQIDATGALQDVAGMKIFKLPWTDAVTSLSEIVLEERKYPLEFWRYIFSDHEYEQITLLLPASRQLVEKPMAVKAECSVARYELTFDVSVKGKLTATRKMVKKKDVVTVEEYKEFQQFMKEVSTADNKQIAIK